jgi:hypothetical protein
MKSTRKNNRPQRGEKILKWRRGLILIHKFEKGIISHDDDI